MYEKCEGTKLQSVILQLDKFYFVCQLLVCQLYRAGIKTAVKEVFMEKAVEEIKALLVGQGIPVFGIADSTLMEDEAHNYRCSDTLTSAKSILCIGMPFPKGVFYSRHRTNETYWRAANIYYRNVDMILMPIA